jgi:tRNA(adenine34) deaminase
MKPIEEFMLLAIGEAKRARDIYEVPVGAIVVKDNSVIGTGFNTVIQDQSVSSHAEIHALNTASKALNNHRLINCDLYVTLEPCMMCLGAIIHSRIQRVVYGAYDTKTGMCESCEDLINSKVYNHEILIKGGVLEINCSELLKSFFKLRR